MMLAHLSLMVDHQAELAIREKRDVFLSCQ
jgi:hypothetical protein